MINGIKTVDPCCGTGTILSELHAYAAHRIIGGDIAREQVQAAKWNLAHAAEHAGVQVQVWDALEMPLASGYVDKVVTNLPFGRQITPEDEAIQTFNHNVMKEISRILKPNGKAVVLSEHDEQIRQEAVLLRLSCLNEDC